MSKINVLSKQTIELIAAGEVVERPASAAKELLENSVDAGATDITLEIKNGGITYMRITDNGSGISREDVKAAFMSHATSKISDARDLDAIYTLGFRGEALASIAAVSRVEILTRARGEDIGTRFVVEGGEAGEPEDAGCPTGTTLIVRDLFFNTPARMKFLKKDISEANAVAGVVDRMALSLPGISFRFIRDGKETLLTPGDGNLDSAVYSVFGREFLDGMIRADYEHGDVRVSGFTSKPSAGRANRSMQFFFLNDRQIKSATASAALSEAYRNSIVSGKFPMCVLSIYVSPHTVDINVHPSKTEVRFSDEKAIFNAVYYCVKNAVEGDRGRVQFTVGSAKDHAETLEVQEDKPEQLRISQEDGYKNDDFWDRIISGGKEPADREEKSGGSRFVLPLDDKTESGLSAEKSAENDFLLKGGLNRQTAAAAGATDSEGELSATIIEDEPVAEQAGETEEFSIIGEAFKTYILAECKGKMLVIDKHAAHERMIFERLKSSGGGADMQILLKPVTVTLCKEDYSSALENLHLFSQSGFCVQDFGNGTVIVSECPITTDSGDIADIIVELSGYLSLNKTLPVSEKIERIYHVTACKSAIKAGDITSDYEMRKFTEKLLSMPEIRSCPHGRPVFIEISRRELEKSFGRTR